MRHLDDDERRRRIAARHAFAPGTRVATPEAATEAVAVLHATEPHTVYLSLAARIEGLALGEIERALYDDRSLVKQLAMRRTLFVFPRALLPAAWGSASARVAVTERARLAKELEKSAVTDDGAAWIAAASGAVLERLADGAGLTAAQLRAELPQLEGRSTPEGVKAWDVSTPFGPRVFTLLGAEGRLMRGLNSGHWRTSRPLWTTTESWLGEAASHASSAAGYAALVGAYLARFGPVSETDIVWWLGATKAAVRAALVDLEAQEVALDGGGVGYVLPGDADETAAVEPWAALLPVLDPTTMGWKERDFYLDPALVPKLFDRNGNAGTTAWWDGRVVGCWVQEPDGSVTVRTCAEVGSSGLAALQREAERLTAWLDGTVISPIYKSPLMQAERQG